MTNTVSIYAAGGTGANILLGMHEIPAVVAWMAQRDVYYVDTSDANLRKSDLPSDRVYKFPGTDGSGKVRGENYALIRQYMPEVISRFPPSLFNIVVSSASGGSGAPIAHCITEEIIRSGGYVINIVIGSTDSEIEIENTLKTIKSLDKLAEDNARPVVCHYLQNQANATRSDINQCALNAIVKLLVLLSGELNEMDTTDLKKWLTHPRIGNELVSLHISDGEPEDYRRAGHVVSVATIGTDELNTGLKPVPVYQAVGIGTVDTMHVMQMPIDSPVNFMISPNSIVSVTEQINAELEEAQSHTRGRVKRDRIADKGDNFGNDSILL